MPSYVVCVLMVAMQLVFTSPLSCTADAAGSGMNADHKNSFGAQGPPSGMGVTKAHSYHAEGSGLYDSPLPGKALPWELWRERLARGLIAFFWVSPCSPLAAAHPYVGSRQRRAGHIGSPNTY